MNDSFERFDMKKPPRQCRWFLKPVAWMIAFPGIWSHKTRIDKTGMGDIKPPYLLLGNHNAFFDMNVSAAATFPRLGNYVVAIDGFIKREWLLRNIGCICKRKFTNDFQVIKHLKRVVDRGGIAVLYPEARYSLCGTTAPLPESLGKLCKLLGVPVVTLICHGNHINHPFWNTRHERKVVPTEAEMTVLLTKDEVNELSTDEINERLVSKFQYDDFKWQLEKHIKVDCKDRAVGLEKILYRCPHCNSEFTMRSSGTQISCTACGKSWNMTEYGTLEAVEGETEYAHIPDWYEWERQTVREEVENGTYTSGELPVYVKSLPNAKGYIELGHGTMVHDMNGFSVDVTGSKGEQYSMKKTVPSLYSCHIEYEYLFKDGDCVDLNTLEDTWYTYPYDKPFSVTKMALATEELYYDYRRRIGKPCKPGLA